MKSSATFFLLASAICLANCGSPPEQNADTQESDAEFQAKLKASAISTEAANGISAIVYPTCGSAVSGGKVTACGKRVFAKAMAECRQRAEVWSPGGSGILDEYTGDSWQAAAGLANVASDEQRLARGNVPNSTQSVAVAIGQGTSDIQLYNCSLDKDMRLTNIAQGEVRHKVTSRG